MRARTILIAICSTAVVIAMGCSHDVVGGNPKLPLSDSNGTSQVFKVSERETIVAISNAFGAQQYRRMQLYQASEEAYLIPGWHPTNGFILFPLGNVGGSITNVPLDRPGEPQVPYVASFYIVTSSLEPKQTKVTVRTIVSEVIDGKELGIHGGEANHHRKVAPVRQEEQNVLSAIVGAVSH